jgi:hypothetical protein
MTRAMAATSFAIDVLNDVLDDLLQVADCRQP